MRAQKANPDRRQVERSLLRLYALGLLAVVVYFVQSDVPTLRGGKPLEHELAQAGDGAGRAVAGHLDHGGLADRARRDGLRQHGRARRTLEVRRIRDALLSGLGIAFALIFAFSVAWVTSERDKKVDLAYFRTTRPGEATRKIVRALDQPVEVATFFPAGNEVREELANYFTDLAKESSQLTFHQYDYDIDPQKAHELTRHDQRHGRRRAQRAQGDDPGPGAVRDGAQRAEDAGQGGAAAPADRGQAEARGAVHRRATTSAGSSTAATTPTSAPACATCASCMRDQGTRCARSARPTA